MSILVTGGTGFVGLNVIEALINRGEHVVVMDRRPLPSSFLRVIGPKQSLVCLESGDVCDQTVVDAVFAGHQITHVFLGAAITAGPTRELVDPHSVIDVNLLGNLNILRACSRTGVKRVMFPSSLTVYGTSLFDRFVCHEAGTPPIPEGLYGITKYAGERMVLRMAALMKLEAVTGRIGAVFGPWETSTGVRDLVSPLSQIARACVLGLPRLSFRTTPTICLVILSGKRHLSSGVRHLQSAFLLFLGLISRIVGMRRLIIMICVIGLVLMRRASRKISVLMHRIVCLMSWMTMPNGCGRMLIISPNNV
jgi:nucleoside-diphosphate-sugar epimerase